MDHCKKKVLYAILFGYHFGSFSPNTQVGDSSSGNQVNMRSTFAETLMIHM